MVKNRRNPRFFSQKGKLSSNVRLPRALRTVLLLLATAPAITQAQFNYQTNDGTITITKYTGPGGAVEIPSETNGLPVVRIGDSAFYACNGLTSVTISGSVTSIGNSAFEACTRLTNVTISDSVTGIGMMAFHKCANLTSVTIPNSVTNMWWSAFGCCSNLTSVSIGSGLSSIDGWAFQYCTSLSSVVMGDSVSGIGSGAFLGCTGLTNFTIPDSVIIIAGWNSLAPYFPGAFTGCTSLTSVTIGTGVTNMLDGSFTSCPNLTEVYFSGACPGFEGFGSGIFNGAPQVTVYYLPGMSGWDNFYGGRRTALWLPKMEAAATGFGLPRNQFGFNVRWATGRTVVVEASAVLASPVWTPVSTNAVKDGWSYFSEAEWTNYPGRFYRIRAQ